MCILSLAAAFQFKTEKEANEFLENCGVSKFHVSDVQVKPGKRSPTAPFTTSTLQQTSSGKFGFGASRTMQIAQRLYQGLKVHGKYVRSNL